MKQITDEWVSASQIIYSYIICDKMNVYDLGGLKKYITSVDRGIHVQSQGGQKSRARGPLDPKFEASSGNIKV